MHVGKRREHPHATMGNVLFRTRSQRDRPVPKRWGNPRSTGRTGGTGTSNPGADCLSVVGVACAKSDQTIEARYRSRALCRRLRPGRSACWASPLVVSAWGSDVLVAPRAEPLIRAIVRICLNEAELITAESAYMKAQIRELRVKSIILQLPVGADTAVFHPATSVNSRSQAHPLIVSTRHLEPIYNVRLLLDALPEILSVYPSAQAVIVGDGSMYKHLNRRASELGIEQSVLFSGIATPSEVGSYLSNADVFVSTSLSDGNNISLKEAMACGAFPVVTDIPANREWIEHGSNGFLVSTTEPHDLAMRVIEGLSSPDLRRAAADLNWKLIQQRGSWKTAMERMESEYFSIMNGICAHDASHSI